MNSNGDVLDRIRRLAPLIANWCHQLRHSSATERLYSAGK